MAIAGITAQAQLLSEQDAASGVGALGLSRARNAARMSQMASVQLQPVVAEENFARERVIHQNALRQITDNAAMLAKQQKTAVPQPVNPNALLYGVNMLALTVLDGKTLRQVAEYTVHAEVVMNGTVLRNGGDANDPFAAGEPQLVQESAAVVGRLESKRVKDAAGRCHYEGLGRLTVRFSIWAKGYLAKTETVRVPEGGPAAIVRLTPAGSIKGRVVDAKTGAPLRGVQVRLSYPSKNRGNHTQEEYADSSNDEGRFCIEGLSADRYMVKMNKVPLALENLAHVAQTEAVRASRGKEDEAGADAFDEAYARSLNAPGYIMPRVEPVELKDGATLDLGTIRLERTPTLELEITYEGQVPLGNFPFELAYSKGLNTGQQARFKTDDDGKARLTLAGWQPGLAVVVYVPEPMDYKYQMKKLLEYLPAPETIVGDEAWYKALSGLTDPPRLATPISRRMWEPEMNDFYSLTVGSVEYEALAPEQKKEFHERLERWKPEYQRARDRFQAMPEHPNYKAFIPHAGEVSRVRLDFKPTTATVDLMLRFIDKTTKQPVARFRGAVGERVDRMAGLMDRLDSFVYLEARGEFRIFRALDGSGQAVVPALELPPSFGDKEIELKQLRRDYPGHARIAALEKDLSLGLVADAPGYTRQTFGVTLDQLRVGGELTFELEPAASVRGRVLLGATGEPLTSATLQALLKRWGCWNEPVARAWTNRREYMVEFSNPTLGEAREEQDNDEENSADNKHIITKTTATIGPDGVFKIDGLLPHADWQCRIETGVLPGYRRKGLALAAGLNDLGEIRLNLSGWLVGKFVDENGQGIEGMMLEFPAEPIGRHDRETTRTRASGDYRLDLLPFKNDRQLVRVIPPWGDNDETTTSPKMKVSAAYETVMTLDRCASNTLAGRLHRGSPLVLRLPPSPRRAELERVYSVQANWPIMGLAAVEDHSKDPAKQPYFAVRRIALQGLEAGPEGLTYAQTCDAPGAGVRLTSGPLELRLERIPPGRYALSVEGGLMDAAKPEDPGTEIERGIYETIPLAYAEFTMPPTSATLELAPGAADIELALDGAPAGGAPSQKTMGPFVFIEREGALSTLHATALRRLLAQARRELRNRWSDEEIEVGALPLLGYFAHFIKPDAAGRHMEGWHPALLRAVPPGSYRVQAYDHPDSMIEKNAAPYFEDRIEVTSQTRTLHVAIPRPPPLSPKR